MENLRVSLVQCDISWENRKENLRLTEKRLAALAGTTDLVVLPEMFSTGFSMKSRELAENADGETVRFLRRAAREFGLAVTGSFIALDNEQYYNRGFFITPDGEIRFYDKRHLFLEERHYFSPGNRKLIVDYLGWKIRLLICYDLRFPVWSRNTNNEYDLLIYVASWPEVRIKVWQNLLIARALENVAYVCGVNRVGTDGNNARYTGESVIVDYKGQPVAATGTGQETVITAVLDLTSLHRFREKFPVWQDADRFTLDL